MIRRNVCENIKNFIWNNLPKGLDKLEISMATIPKIHFNEYIESLNTVAINIRKELNIKWIDISSDIFKELVRSYQHVEDIISFEGCKFSFKQTLIWEDGLNNFQVKKLEFNHITITEDEEDESNIFLNSLNNLMKCEKVKIKLDTLEIKNCNLNLKQKAYIEKLKREELKIIFDSNDSYL